MALNTASSSMFSARATSAMPSPSSGWRLSIRAYRYTRRKSPGAVGRYSSRNMFSMGVTSYIPAPSAKLQNGMGSPSFVWMET